MVVRSPPLFVDLARPTAAPTHATKCTLLNIIWMCFCWVLFFLCCLVVVFGFGVCGLDFFLEKVAVGVDGLFFFF